MELALKRGFDIYFGVIFVMTDWGKVCRNIIFTKDREKSEIVAGVPLHWFEKTGVRLRFDLSFRVRYSDYLLQLKPALITARVKITAYQFSLDRVLHCVLWTSEIANTWIIIGRKMFTISEAFINDTEASDVLKIDVTSVTELYCLK